MNDKLAKSLLGTACLTMLAVGSANAGGLERGGYNIDLLFRSEPVRLRGDGRLCDARSRDQERPGHQSPGRRGANGVGAARRRLTAPKATGCPGWASRAAWVRSTA